MSKIGIWNTAFLGDAVLTLPLIQTVKAAYPDAEVHFFVRKGLKSLFQAQPEIAFVHEYDKRGEQKGMTAAMQYGRKLSGMGFSLWISAHTSLRSGIIARWTSARTRIGYDSPWVNKWLYTHTVSRKFTELDEIERLLQLTKPLNVPNVYDWPELILEQNAYLEAEQFWANCVEKNTPVVGLHPGSVWGTKRWPATYYGEIATRAVEHGANVFVFGGPDETHMAKEVLDACSLTGSGKVFDLSGKLSLPLLAAYLRKLNCYVTNDSGPMHLAWAQRTPTVAVFGPTVRELGFFPRGESSTVLEADVECRPCGLHGPQECPKGHFFCMHNITPDIVWQAVAKYL